MSTITLPSHDSLSDTFLTFFRILLLLFPFIFITYVLSRVLEPFFPLAQGGMNLLSLWTVHTANNCWEHLLFGFGWEVGRKAVEPFSIPRGRQFVISWWLEKLNVWTICSSSLWWGWSSLSACTWFGVPKDDVLGRVWQYGLVDCKSRTPVWSWVLAVPVPFL